MTVKIITCAALLLAACGGAQPPKEEAKAPETRTEVKHGAEIALLKPDSKAGIMQEVRKREHYEKPSVKRKKKSEAARKRKFN